ncbi:hypothetical protein [Deefgea piscis]|uniref:hypothetical protein n=1 Tax=Deefgea piscis TaxID=2739061 RepID=UPI001C80080F|nr:hypothetical protein [Deefgea piscis]QZA80683.1 hypothetical protein K4H25_14455 [Deefgea piscis]
MKNNLVEVLKKFNRKERYWLINNALDNPSLGKTFIGRLSVALSAERVEIPLDAWWAMDYHIDWLVGAFYTLRHGEKSLNRVFSNHKTEPPLIAGTQQDIDFIIAFHNTLILIEAKGEGSWSGKQLPEKISRLNRLLGNQQDDDGKFWSFNELNLKVFFVLMSPDNPSYPLEDGCCWELKDGKNLNWIQLTMSEQGEPASFLKVIRCKDEEGTTGNEGTHFKIG